MKYFAIATTLLLCACNGSGNDDSSMGDMDMTDTDPGECVATDSVAIHNFAFVPSCVKTQPGATVTFTNMDSTTHTVTSDASQSQTFDSGSLRPNDTFPLTITGSGTVNGHCNIHASMHFALEIAAP